MARRKARQHPMQEAAPLFFLLLAFGAPLSSSSAARGVGAASNAGSCGDGASASGGQFPGLGGTGSAYDQEKVGNTDAGMPDFVPPKWMDTSFGRKFPKYEHGTMEGFNDSGEESEAEHLRAQGAEPRPPDWYRQLETQFKYAQEGRWWEKAGQVGDTGPLGVQRRVRSRHQQRAWENIHAKMSELCDPGCGHDVPSFHEGREYIRAMMRSKDPTKNGKDLIDKIKANRQKADEQMKRKRAAEARADGEHSGDQSSGDCDSDDFYAKAVGKPRLPGYGTLGVVEHVPAQIFEERVIRADPAALVVVLVEDSGREDCALLSSICHQLARTYPPEDVHFKRTSYKYVLPDIDTVTELPTVLLFRRGELVHRITDLGCHSLGIQGRIISKKGRVQVRSDALDSLKRILSPFLDTTQVPYDALSEDDEEDESSLA